MTSRNTPEQYYAQERSSSDITAGEWAEGEENDPVLGSLYLLIYGSKDANKIKLGTVEIWSLCISQQKLRHI